MLSYLLGFTKLNTSSDLTLHLINANWILWALCKGTLFAPLMLLGLTMFQPFLIIR